MRIIQLARLINFIGALYLLDCAYTAVFGKTGPFTTILLTALAFKIEKTLLLGDEIRDVELLDSRRALPVPTMKNALFEELFSVLGRLPADVRIAIAQDLKDISSLDSAGQVSLMQGIVQKYNLQPLLFEAVKSSKAAPASARAEETEAVDLAMARAMQQRGFYAERNPVAPRSQVASAVVAEPAVVPVIAEPAVVPVVAESAVAASGVVDMSTAPTPARATSKPKTALQKRFASGLGLFDDTPDVAAPKARVAAPKARVAASKPDDATFGNGLKGMKFGKGGLF